MKKRSASTGNSHQKTTPLFNSLNNLDLTTDLFLFLLKEKEEEREIRSEIPPLPHIHIPIFSH
jgi:hypothetical protein